MSTPGSRAMTIGLTVMVVSVSAAMHLGVSGCGLLLCFGGVLVGASLVVAGVCMADGCAPVAPMAFDGARALAAFVGLNIATVGLAMAYCAFMALSGEAGPVLCLAILPLLLLGVSLINIAARGE